MLGAAAIAVYVGAEVSIGSIMISFLNSPDTLGLPLLVGQIADHAGLALVFVVPLVGYAYIAAFAMLCARSAMRSRAAFRTSPVRD